MIFLTTNTEFGGVAGTGNAVLITINGIELLSVGMN